jgi:hypothetical protein
MTRSPIVAVCCALTALALLPATAAADRCDDQLTRPFAPWGDDADYAEAPGGLFTSELDWTATGAARLVADSNPYALGADDTTSAALDKGDTITSPLICVSRYHPHLRFAARALDKAGHLGLAVLWTDEHGKAKEAALDDTDGNRYRSWGLSNKIRLNKVLPRDESIRSVQLRFTARDGKGSWLVDNVFVDPVKSG